MWNLCHVTCTFSEILLPWWLVHFLKFQNPLPCDLYIYRAVVPQPPSCTFSGISEPCALWLIHSLKPTVHLPLFPACTFSENSEPFFPEFDIPWTLRPCLVHRFVFQWSLWFVICRIKHNSSTSTWKEPADDAQKNQVVSTAHTGENPRTLHFAVVVWLWV